MSSGVSFDITIAPKTSADSSDGIWRKSYTLVEDGKYILVANGIVDASSVDSLVLDYDRHLGKTDALNVRIIEVLFPGGAGIPPVVVSSKVGPSLKKNLTRILTGMHRDPEGRKILKQALMLRFDPPDDHNYDDIKKHRVTAAAGSIRGIILAVIDRNVCIGGLSRVDSFSQCMMVPMTMFP